MRKKSDRLTRLARLSVAGSLRAYCCVALAQAHKTSRNATAFVLLSPLCQHVDRTPPCYQCGHPQDTSYGRAFRHTACGIFKINTSPKKELEIMIKNSVLRILFSVARKFRSGALLAAALFGSLDLAFVQTWIAAGTSGI